MSLTKKIERLFIAVTFAEAGEFETANAIMAENTQEPETKSHDSRTGVRNINPNTPGLTTDAA